MKSKKLNKTECAACKYFTGECTHKSNIGIKVKYRQETEFFVHKAEELNKEGDCKHYAKKGAQ